MIYKKKYEFRYIASRDERGKKRETINLDNNKIKSICDAVLANKFEDSEIILNCEVVKGKKPKYKFIQKYQNILGDIIIEPNYNRDDEDFTVVSIIDGYHRCKGIIMALIKNYEKEGKWLEGTISIRLVRATKERANRIVNQSFQRIQDKLEWSNTLEENDYTKFVDNLVSSSEFLTIENTTDEAVYSNKLTSKSLLVDIFKETNINVNDLSDNIFTSQAIAKNFDIIYDILKKQRFELNPQFVAGFIYLGYFVDSDVVQLFNYTNKLIETREFLSVCRRNGKAQTIIKTIENILNEGL